MSLRAVLWALDEAEVESPLDALVLIALADEADDDGGSCYPSMRRIAGRARVSTNTVRAHLASLENLGLVVVDRPKKQGRGHHNRYQLALPQRVKELDPSPSERVEKGSSLSRADPLPEEIKPSRSASPVCEKCGGDSTSWKGVPNPLCRSCYETRPRTDGGGRVIPEPIPIAAFVPEATEPDPNRSDKLAAVRKMRL